MIIEAFHLPRRRAYPAENPTVWTWVRIPAVRVEIGNLTWQRAWGVWFGLGVRGTVFDCMSVGSSVFCATRQWLFVSQEEWLDFGWWWLSPIRPLRDRFSRVDGVCIVWGFGFRKQMRVIKFNPRRPWRGFLAGIRE